MPAARWTSSTPSSPRAALPDTQHRRWRDQGTRGDILHNSRSGRGQRQLNRSSDATQNGRVRPGHRVHLPRYAGLSKDAAIDGTSALHSARKGGCRTASSFIQSFSSNGAASGDLLFGLDDPHQNRWLARPWQYPPASLVPKTSSAANALTSPQQTTGSAASASSVDGPMLHHIALRTNHQTLITAR